MLKTRQLSRKVIGSLVISYLRFSRPEQMKGDSKRRQTEGAEAYCKAHGLTLTDRLEDLGISAFRGANRSKGALSVFLELVQAGTVPAGSILLIEDLDRLSRQAPEEALELFLSIIRAGVTIVTLIDGQEYRKGELDMMRLMSSIMRICLAHEESSKKSMRLGKAWKQKRANIATKPLTSLLPAWLKIVDGKIVIDEPKAEIVRTMYRMVIEGFGLSVIGRRLNESATSIGRKAYFNRSYVFKCLHNPHVIGEFQPHKLKYDLTGRKTREPVGEPVKGYYPAIVDEQVYYAARRMMSDRFQNRGPSTEFVNLFKGLMFHAVDKTPMVVTHKRKDCRQYVSAAAMEHRKNAAPYVAFPIQPLESAILRSITSVKELSTKTTENKVALELAAVEGRFADLASRINQTAAALATAGNIASVVEVLAKMEAEKKMLEKRRHELEADLSMESNSTADVRAAIVALLQSTEPITWNGFLDSLGVEPPALNAEGFIVQPPMSITDYDARIKLRTSIRQIVTRIDVQISKDGKHRTARYVITMKDAAKSIQGELEIHVANPKGVEQAEKCRKMWKQGIRPVEIAQAAGVNVSQVYRLCAGVKREKPMKAHSRWDKR